MTKKYELNEMEMELVAGGHPHVRLHPPVNPLKKITQAVHTIKNIIKTIFG